MNGSPVPPELDIARSPVDFADRAARLFLSETTREGRKGRGQYFTPREVASFMVDLSPPLGESIRVLDPGTGSGILACAVIEAAARPGSLIRQLEVVAYECDPRLASVARESLNVASEWLLERGVSLSFRIYERDFVLDCSPALSRALSSGEEGEFDYVISNPPYLKIQRGDSRAIAASSVVRGQPNLYALFMAASAAMLKRGGQFVFIVPRSFTAGPYFQLFRERFFKMMRPTALHLFGSRKDAFSSDSVLQENVILRAERDDDWQSRQGEERVAVSESAGTSDLGSVCPRSIPVTRVVEPRARDSVVRIPTTVAQDAVIALVDSWPHRLASHGLKISTGPVVPFRTDAIIHGNAADPHHAPLLWMQNVRAMQVRWPISMRKGQVLRIDANSRPLLVETRNCVVMRRFSAKEENRRIVAAPLLAQDFDGDLLALENHLNYVHGQHIEMTAAGVFGIAALLNSSIIDTYFRTSNGNTQVSATELRALPLPNLGIIQAIGTAILRLGPLEQTDLQRVDAIVNRFVKGGG